MSELKAYDVNVRGKNWSQTINAFSPGKAKYEYFTGLREAWPDIPFTALSVRSLGRVQDTEEFRRTAEYRGVRFAHVGMLVHVGEWSGYIVGCNASANFDVAFMDGPHKGLTLNCHPNHQMRFFDENGEEIVQTREVLATA